MIGSESSTSDFDNLVFTRSLTCVAGDSFLGGEERNHDNALDPHSRG